MKFQIKRYISQLFFLISANLGVLGLKTGFCYPFFYCNGCPASTSSCPIRAIEVGLFEGKLKWKILIFPFVIIGFIGITTGRAMCGWACPIGLLQRATGKVNRKIKTKVPFLSKIDHSKIDHYLRYTKYVVFVALVILTPIFIAYMFTDICPVGILTGTFAVLGLNPGVYKPSEYFLPAFIVFILFVILILIVERGWCRYFCPVGAMLAPFNKVSFLHVDVDIENCIHCNACSDVCPMGIDVPNMNRDPECILCGKCVNECPKNLIKFKKV